MIEALDKNSNRDDIRTAFVISHAFDLLAVIHRRCAILGTSCVRRRIQDAGVTEWNANRARIFIATLSLALKNRVGMWVI